MSEVTIEGAEEQAVEDEVSNLEEANQEVENIEQNSDVENQNDEQSENVEETEELELSIGDESLTSQEEKEEAPAWVKELRKTNREQAKRLKEYERKLAEKESPPDLTLGPEPTLEQFDYDEDKFKSAWSAWKQKDSEIKERQKVQMQAEQAAAEEWNQKLDTHSKKHQSLKFKDKDEVESLVQNTLSPVQQGIIVNAANDSALLMYAIGKNPERAQELAKIQDPIKFAFEVARLEKDLKVTKKTSVPAPERQVSGSNRSSNPLDSTLEKLRAEARKTGNFSKVHQYKQNKKRNN